MTVALLALLLAFFAGGAKSLPKAELFPFGREQYLPSNDDVSSPDVHLLVPIVFYGSEYRSIYVNDNGLLSFLTEVPSFFNAQFPLTYPIIAPLYSDVDVRGTGRVYYRETQDQELLDRARKDLSSHFSSASTFHPRSLFIATWDEVGFYNKAIDKLNTFQVVIASDGADSYAYFLYPSGGVQWIQGQGKNVNLPDARAQAGFMSGDGRLYTLRGSGTEQARNFDRMSNAKKAGVWLFHIGRTTASGGNILPPDIDPSGATDNSQEYAGATCLNTLLPCPPHATCVDNPDNKGFCCVCKNEYFGNGRNCMEKNAPQRMNGKVNGVINDIQITDADLHAYIVTEDGRTYTAISRVPPSVGSDLQVLTPLGGVVGWLFAVSRSEAPNGFTITGGVFNRTVEIDFPQSGHHVFIEESFMGLDVFNYMRMQVKIRGSVPSIGLGSSIEVADYEEEYTRTAPGVVRSHASRSYRLEGNRLEVPFTVDQTISYTECQAPMSSTRLKVARNFIVYDAGQQIVRYAMSNKVSPLSVEDPCKDGQHLCGPNSNCVVEGDSFRCACAPGYQYIYEQDSSNEQPTCIDMNECVLGRHNCHIFAECINLQGSFACRCQQGYVGDGSTCERKKSCDDLNCDPHADCIERNNAGPTCQCRLGYVGDGLTCTVATEDDCSVISYCDLRADCVFVPQLQRHECRCRAGYTGDGVVCVEDSCDVTDNCSPNGKCLYDTEGEVYYCACNPGHSGDGYTCIPEGATCDVINNCHPHAECVFSSQLQTYHCKCSAGYHGDGTICARVVERSCDKINYCSPHAFCVRDEFSGHYVCRCIGGFEGDGETCNPVDECNTADNCDANAQCVFDSASQRYRCQCLPGFKGQGRIGTCVVDPDVSCNIRNTCHELATCALDPVDQIYRCQCNPGYEGDGFKCERTSLPCNVINNCHIHAECRLDPGYREYRCQCLPGYDGDGHLCRSLRSCREDPYQCDHNADCAPDLVTGEYACQCKEGYVGDGSSCTVVPQYSGGHLVFAHGMSLLRVPTTPTKSNPGQILLMEPNQTPVGLSTDCQKGHLYWADASLKVIRRANYNGSEVTLVISSDMLSPEGIAVDWLGRNIFWTDSGKDTIEVASISKGYRKVLISEGLENPRGIAVHPGLGKMYWTDWSRKEPKIEVASMDGTGRADLVTENLALPNMVTIDFDRNNLCWTDSVFTGFGRIECIGLNGQSRRLVYTPAPYPFGIAIHEGYIYWTDWEIKFLHRVDINGGEAEPLPVPAGGSGRMYGLVSLPSYCPAVRSPCAVENGGCRYLCLPDGRGSRSCVCPDSSEDDSEHITCNEIRA